MTDPIGTAQERELIEALDNIKFGLDFAYEQGLHEFGYDPVAYVRDALQSRIAEVGRLTDLLDRAFGYLSSVDPDYNHGEPELVKEIAAALSLQRRV